MEIARGWDTGSAAWEQSAETVVSSPCLLPAHICQTCLLIGLPRLRPIAQSVWRYSLRLLLVSTGQGSYEAMAALCCFHISATVAYPARSLMSSWNSGHANRSQRRCPCQVTFSTSSNRGSSIHGRHACIVQHRCLQHILATVAHRPDKIVRVPWPGFSRILP